MSSYPVAKEADAPEPRDRETAADNRTTMAVYNANNPNPRSGNIGGQTGTALSTNYKTLEKRVTSYKSKDQLSPRTKLVFFSQGRMSGTPAVAMFQVELRRSLPFQAGKVLLKVESFHMTNPGTANANWANGKLMLLQSRDLVNHDSWDVSGGMTGHLVSFTGYSLDYPQPDSAGLIIDSDRLFNMHQITFEVGSPSGTLPSDHEWSLVLSISYPDQE
jgi:hypothetical protein